MYKLSKDPLIAAPYFCEACGLHFGLNLKNSIQTIKHINHLKLKELEEGGHYFNIDITKIEDENFQSREDFRNLYFHAGFCGYCNSNEVWIELKQILDGLN